ncbi:MAG: hypothetical protein MK212_01700 [Saprospiraceae bacterium]|nr:hypothetical protein [Saprospiraceae bacterium]
MLSVDKYKILNQQVIEKLNLKTTGGFVEQIKRQNDLLYIRGVVTYKEENRSEEYILVLADERLESSSYEDRVVSFFPSCIRINKPLYTFTALTEETGIEGKQINPKTLDEEIKELESLENRFKRQVKNLRLKQQFRNKLNRIFSDLVMGYNNKLIRILKSYASNTSSIIDNTIASFQKKLESQLVEQGKKHQYRIQTKTVMDNTIVYFIVPSTVNYLDFSCCLMPIDDDFTSTHIFYPFNQENSTLKEKRIELLDTYASKPVRKWEEAAIIAKFKEDTIAYLSAIIGTDSFPHFVLKLRKYIQALEEPLEGKIKARKEQEEHLKAVEAAKKLIEDLF